MSESVTLYKRSNAYYYTRGGMEDYLANVDSSASFTPVDNVTKYDITVRAIDADSCTFWLATSDGSNGGSSRTENGKAVWYRRNDNQSNVLSYSVYKRGTSWISVYGAHPAHPNNCLLATYISHAVKVVPNSNGKYLFRGELTFDDGVYDSVADNLASGTEYAAAKITFSNSNNLIWFGESVGLDKSYAVYCGFPWWFHLSPVGFSWADGQNPNSSTTTVADGKKRALVTDVEDYNGGSNASLSTKSSTGSLTITYWYLMRAGLGRYLPEYSLRVLRSLTTTESGGSTIVLRGVNTKADLTGTYYPVGSDVSEVLTRRPTYDTYRTRVTLYGVFARRWTVTVEANGGSGASSFYYSPDTCSFYADQNLAEAVQSIAPYTKGSAQFLGLFTTDDPTGTRAVSPSGEFDGGWVPTGGCTLYAQWRTVIEITLSKEGGTGGADAVWYDSSAGGFVLPNRSEAVSSVSVPTLECYSFRGYYTASSGGTQYIGSDGSILAAFTESPPASAITLYAQWGQRVSWKMTLDADGGTGGDAKMFCNGSDAEFFRDDQLTVGVDAVEAPVLTGHAFGGYYTEPDGAGTQCIDEHGNVVMSAFASDGTLYAKWTPKEYTVTFNYGIGSGMEESRTVTWGRPIGTLPSVTAPAGNYTFDGWRLDGSTVTDATPWQKDGNGILEAVFFGSFGGVTDYFGLASSRLVPVSSDSGDSRRRVAVRHYGRFEGGDQNAPVAWRNPTVTYMVVGDMTLDVALGTAFHAQSGVTGYMITSVQIATALGAFPMVTVKAVANEGVAAINVFRAPNGNAYGIPILARAWPQNLLGAVSGGGDLQSFTLTLACDPVVLAENMRPCASDVVSGRLEVEAETRATPLSFNAPSAANGFTSDGAQNVGGGTDYTRWRIRAWKEL